MLTPKVSKSTYNTIKTRTHSTIGKTAVNLPSQTTDMQQIASQSDTIVQAQLETTQPGDRYEQEADATANLVMRKLSSGESTSPSVSSRTSAPVISCFGGGGLRLSSCMESQLNSMSGGGHAMPAGLRSQMEGSFGRSFSGVRLHTDASADNLSRQLQAKAFTHGNDIYFGQGQYNPTSQQGQSLIAHELTHTVQQSGRVARSPFDGYTAAAVDFSNRFKNSKFGFSKIKYIKAENYKDQSDGKLLEDLNADVLLFSGHQYTQCTDGEEGVFSSDGYKDNFCKEGTYKYDFFYLKNLLKINDVDKKLDKVKLIISTSCATLSKDNNKFKNLFPNLKIELGYIHSAPENGGKIINAFLKRLENKRIDIESSEGLEIIRSAWFQAGFDSYGSKSNEEKEKKYKEKMLATREWKDTDENPMIYIYDNKGSYKKGEQPDVHFHSCYSPEKEVEIFTSECL